MYGAILGDIIGSPYEFGIGDKTKDFPLFYKNADSLETTGFCSKRWPPESSFTDDSVMTVAVAEALTDCAVEEAEVKQKVTSSMQRWGREYPNAGYGSRFYEWIFSDYPEPYGSWGNGSAMRVSPVGWLYESLEETRRVARWTAEVSHDHPEGVKGAESVAACIWLARNGYSKEDIKKYVEYEFVYDLDRTCDEIRPGYRHVESCQQSVPESIICFLEGEDFEDTVRLAVSLGGDTDTMACIAGSIAEAYFGIPDDLISECRSRVSEEMLPVIDRFNTLRLPKKTEYPEMPIESFIPDIHVRHIPVIEEQETEANESSGNRMEKIILFFLFYSACGWIYEVLVGIAEGRGLINRGFLFGPWLPVYGFGAFLILALKPLMKHGVPAVFAASTVIATAAEFVTSYLMQAVIGVWLWDYSKEMWNFQGRVAPWPGIRFGLLSLLMLYIIHPVLEKYLDTLPQKTARIIAVIFGALFLLDCAARFFLGSNLTDPALF